MLQLMKYQLYSMLREKTTMFWTFLFPLIMCTLFYVTFGNVDQNLACIDTAVVVKNETEKAAGFYTFLETIEESEKDFISVEKMSEKEAKQQLKDGEIWGIYYLDTELELVVASNDVEESILQGLMESYQSNYEVVENVAKEKPENLQKVIERVSSDAVATEYVKETSLGGKESDGMIQYFFSLIAMTCMFGCFLGFDAALRLQANIAPVAIRRCLGATSKLKLILSDFILICMVNFVDVLVLIGYMAGVLKLDLGNDIGRILLVSFMGCIIGVSMGLLIGSIGKWKEGTKITIMLGISLGSSFLSGLMVSGIKGLLEKYCPIVNRINPSSLIADAFYCLSVYEDMERYTRNIIAMAVWSIVFLAGSFFMVRRVRYDSI